jgi:pilus assembly protein TadC
MNRRESMTGLLDTFGRSFVFERYREPLRQYFLKAGFERTPYAAFGLGFFVLVALTYVLFLVFLPSLADYGPATKGVAALVFWLCVLGGLVALTCIGIVFVLNLKIYARVHTMESVLPDYLQLVITNLKSGMNFEQSLWSAARPEFGILSAEITLVSKQVLTGVDTPEALRAFALRYDSPTLMRSFNLIIGEVRAGGKVVDVIERITLSLRRTRELKDEMSANVLNFIIFITVIVCVLTPVLFALANTLLGVMIGFASMLGGSLAAGGSALGGASSFGQSLAAVAERGPEMQTLFRTFSYWAIGLIALSASLIVSIIEKGDIRGGIKYVPIFTVVALVLFAILQTLFTRVFSGIVGI